MEEQINELEEAQLIEVKKEQENEVHEELNEMEGSDSFPKPAQPKMPEKKQRGKLLF